MQINESILKHNLELFRARFPELASLMSLNCYSNVKTLIEKIPCKYHVVPCKKNKNALTLCIGEKYLHSKYDAIFEAGEICKNDFFKNDKTKKNIAFVGLGLGYVAEHFMQRTADARVIIIEPDIFVFLEFLASRNLSKFFAHEKLMLLIGLPPIEVLHFLYAAEAEHDLDTIPLFFSRASESAAPAWYSEFKTLQKRNEAKKQINANTEKKFLKLWSQNLIKNFLFVSEHPVFSLEIFQSCFQNYPALIFAGGPSLERDIKIFSHIDLSRVIVIAVDTAARAVQRARIKIDFVISGDPQYANFKHIQDVNIGNTVLIAEATSYPHTLRLATRATCLFSQQLPLETFFFAEAKKHKKNISLICLDSGGSVATSAFSFARYLGAHEIYFSGLDLSFINKQTHFRGSTFEEATHRFSSKINSAQTQLLASLFSVQAFYAASNANTEKNQGMQKRETEVLSDAKMRMFAWWFESKIHEYGKDISVFTFSDKGLHIPGINVESLENAPLLFKNATAYNNTVDQKINKILQNASTLSVAKADVYALGKQLHTSIKKQEF